MLGVEWEGITAQFAGDGQEQKETPKERGLLPGTKGLSRVMWVEIGRWGNVPRGGWVGIG